MKTLKLKNKLQADATTISNDFVDHHLAQANGEFVKVYLVLLRHLEDPSSTVTVSKIADCLNHTEKDILRALRYWESVGVLSLGKESERKNTENIPEKKKTPSMQVTESMPEIKSTVPAKSVTPAKPAAPVRSSGTVSEKELKSLLFIAEQYLGKTLSKSDTDAITYFYDKLGMSADLVEYLIETCVENGHKSMHYIQKVALSWSDDGIETVAQAKERSLNYNKNCYTVLNAFGIKNRGPAISEVSYIQKWTNDYGFTLDIIQEACNRTISAIHQPSFEYADTILEKWHTGQVHHLKDVERLDAAFQKEKSEKKIIRLSSKERHKESKQL